MVRTVKPCEISIERAKRQMTGFAGNLKTSNQAQRTGDNDPRQCDDCCILERRSLFQHAIDRVRDLRRAMINRVENPQRFCQHEVGYSRPFCDKSLRGIYLIRIISHDHPHQQIGINGVHASAGCAF